MREGKNALLMAQDWSIVQGLGQQLLSLTRCCIACVPEVTPAVPSNGALEPKLCIVPGLPRNAICLVLEPIVWLSTGQLVPQPFLGLPGSCINNIFASKTLTPWKLLIHKNKRRKSEIVVN